ncbi:DUF2309 domain-containing protein [Mycobacterium sp. IDR2000157661]|uniref:DUF2309 domain-containing protein n=1 Tax=Mycobacterium sp. IDR2000157661 TaxID=2867005 RepID=UPI001EE9C02E|nr:DUF2309 domain-containing protein [Mycobacterium sp. IDR2000157661]ULE32062.1 DUF2309 domain-containing protein [Mycobacterium sp. IDR2000157661]
MTVEVLRAQLRADIALAAKVVPTHYPLGTFIAVNPLAGLEAVPFEQAVHRAGDLYGTPGTLPEEAFRALYQAGRITDANLDDALGRRYPGVVAQPALQLGGREVSPSELLRQDMLHGRPAPKPMRRFLSRAEETRPQVADTVDALAGKWCAAFFGSAPWPMPGREDGFFRAWRALAPADRTLPRRTRKALRALPARADDAALHALSALDVGADARTGYLQAHLTRLPGWAAHVQWCTGRDQGIDLLDYLAMRLSYEAALLDAARPTLPRSDLGQRVPSARQRAAHLAARWGLEAAPTELTAAARVLSAVPVSIREALWQQAFESNYRDRLLADLSTHRGTGTRSPAAAQVVCCIDARSEGLRRHLESRGGYETFGFAGFFAVAIRYTDLAGGAAADLCPVLINPNHDIREVAADGAQGAAARRLSGTTAMAGADSAFHAAKDAFLAPFTLAEAAGWVAAPMATVKTLLPTASASARRGLHRLAAPPAPTVVDVDGVDLEQRALFARVALTTMGLTDCFARLVVLCAHGSSTENNPYQAALDCGACGGQPGGPNARTAAAILNQPAVRSRLSEAGIRIPADTYFLAAQHDTTTDRVRVFDHHLVPASHRADLQRLVGDLAHAGEALAAERSAMLPGAPKRRSTGRAARHVATRSADWGQVYPEWGLAGNAAFVVAPRAVTEGLDLKRRVFLHSYEADVDADGTALETILTAPLVVAQWINCQYYFSSVAPDVFGAGTKVIHNVVGTAGVLSGHTGDLRLGLPWQSVAGEDGLVHEPLRLLAVVQAPLARIDTIVARNPILQRLFGNDWVGLAARDHPGQSWQRWTRCGWQDWNQTPIPVPLMDEEITR